MANQTIRLSDAWKTAIRLVSALVLSLGLCRSTSSAQAAFDCVSAFQPNPLSFPASTSSALLGKEASPPSPSRPILRLPRLEIDHPRLRIANTALLSTNLDPKGLIEASIHKMWLNQFPLSGQHRLAFLSDDPISNEKRKAFWNQLRATIRDEFLNQRKLDRRSFLRISSHRLLFESAQLRADLIVDQQVRHEQGWMRIAQAMSEIDKAGGKSLPFSNKLFLAVSIAVRKLVESGQIQPHSAIYPVLEFKDEAGATTTYKTAFDRLDPGHRLVPQNAQHLMTIESFESLVMTHRMPVDFAPKNAEYILTDDKVGPTGEKKEFQTFSLGPIFYHDLLAHFVGLLAYPEGFERVNRALSGFKRFNERESEVSLGLAPILEIAPFVPQSLFASIRKKLDLIYGAARISFSERRDYTKPTNHRLDVLAARIIHLSQYDPPAFKQIVEWTTSLPKPLMLGGSESDLVGRVKPMGRQLSLFDVANTVPDLHRFPQVVQLESVGLSSMIQSLFHSGDNQIGFVRAGPLEKNHPGDAAYSLTLAAKILIADLLTDTDLRRPSDPLTRLDSDSVAYLQMQMASDVANRLHDVIYDLYSPRN